MASKYTDSTDSTSDSSTTSDTSSEVNVVYESSRPMTDSFRIVAKPFHMYRYCHGVNISTMYRHIAEEWSGNDVITTYHGSRAWHLHTRRRKDQKRVSILDGWIEFCDDLRLKIGDIMVFNSRAGSLHHFLVQIYTNV